MVKRKTLGIALGGGAALGTAHVGVLKAFEEKGVQIDMISGTSVGALVGALYAFGMTVDDMITASSDLNWFDITELTLSKFGVLSNAKMKRFLKKHIEDAEFKNANIPLSIVTTDITTGEKVVLDEGNVLNAVVASACIPGVFVPVKYENRLLVDGGISENVPISPLLAKKADIVIGVDLNATVPQRKPGNIIDVLVNSFEFMLMSASREQVKEADLVIAPDLSEFSVTSTRNAKKKIQIGYECAMAVLDQI